MIQPDFPTSPTPTLMAVASMTVFCSGPRHLSVCSPCSGRCRLANYLQATRLCYSLHSCHTPITRLSNAASVDAFGLQGPEKLKIIIVCPTKKQLHLKPSTEAPWSNQGDLEAVVISRAVEFNGSSHNSSLKILTIKKIQSLIVDYSHISSRAA